MLKRLLGTLRSWLVICFVCSSLLVFAYIFPMFRSDPHLLRTMITPTSVYGVTFSPDRQLLAVCGRDGLLQLWRVTDGQLVRTLTGHQSSVLAVAFSPDGQLLVSGGSDGTVRLWQVATGRELRILLEQHPDPAHAVYTLDPTGRQNIVDIPFYNVIFSPDGHRVAVGSNEGRIFIIQIETGDVIRSFQGHFFHNYYREVLSVAFSPDGELLASAGTGDSACLWQVTEGRLLRQFKMPTTNADILNMAFSPDGKTLLLGRLTADVEQWTIENGHLISSIKAPYEEVRSVAFSPDREIFALGGGSVPNEYEGIPFLQKKKDTRIFVWRFGDSQPMLVLKGHTNNVDAVAFSPDGQFLASGGADNTIRLWRVR